VAFAPRGVPHTYANLSGRPARVLLVITPAAGRLSSAISSPPDSSTTRGGA